MDVKRPFWAWTFSEADGTPSFSRVITVPIVFFALGWVTHIVWKTGALPDFMGLIAFISAIYLGGRGITGATSVGTSIANKDNNKSNP